MKSLIPLFFEVGSAVLYSGIITKLGPLIVSLGSCEGVFLIPLVTIILTWTPSCMLLVNKTFSTIDFNSIFEYGNFIPVAFAADHNLEK